MIKTVTATRYITPLREGGSLPAIVEADDGQQYVMKFVGAGQGPKALIADLIAGEMARHLGFRIPEIVLMSLDPMLGRSEPDPEIQDLLQASAGRLNLGMVYLPNAFEFNMMLNPAPDRLLASQVVWFDAYITNVDRTDRNVNLLIWNEALWLIDHGAALYFHHNWAGFEPNDQSKFAMIKDHTLLRFAHHIAEADELLRPQLNTEILEAIMALIPDEWLGEEERFANHDEHRQAYVTYLLNRLAQSSIFVEEAINAQAQLV
ncbi:MAG: HipA family kinase [Chloroflexota bacterium]